MSVMRETLQANNPKCAPCCLPENQTALGSNGVEKRRACKVCGHLDRQAVIKKATKKPDECKHKHTSYEGSDRSTHRVFWFDCCTFIAEMPQAESKAQKQKEQDAHHRGETLKVEISRHGDQKLTQVQAEQVLTAHIIG